MSTVNLNYSHPESTIDFCMKQTVWKYRNKPQEVQQIISLQDYLRKKMGKLILLFSETQQASVKYLFLKKIDELISKKFDFPKYDCQELIQKIEKRFESCFPTLNYEKIPMEYTWSENNGQNLRIRLLWTLGQDSKHQSPALSILFLKAEESFQQQGVATRILRIFVEELQGTLDPHATLNLHAMSGYNNSLGSTTGAFHWARLGFDYDKDLPPNKALEATFLQKIQQTFQHIIRRDEIFLIQQMVNDKRKDPDWEDHDENDIKSVATEALEETKDRLSHISYPWDIAMLNINGFPIGKYLMLTAEASFKAIMHPNLPFSPGMVQHIKRIQELTDKGFETKP